MNLNAKICGVVASAIIMLFPIYAYAERQTVEADGYYTMGDGENIAVAKQRALDAAVRMASEAVGVFVESHSTVQMGKLTQDEIKTLSASVLKIQNSKIVPTIVGEDVVRYHCHIEAVVDSDNITKYLQDYGERLMELISKIQELEEIGKKKDIELAALKQQYSKTQSEQNKIEVRKKIAENDNAYMSRKLTEEAYRLICEHGSKREDVREKLKKAMDLDPNNVVAMALYAGECDDSKIAKKAIECDPSYAPAYVAYVKTKGWRFGGYSRDLALYIGYIDKALELSPTYAEAYFVKGLLYFGKAKDGWHGPKQKTDKYMRLALESINKAIYYYENDARWKYEYRVSNVMGFRAIIYAYMGDMKQAKKDLKKQKENEETLLGHTTSGYKYFENEMNFFYKVGKGKVEIKNINN